MTGSKCPRLVIAGLSGDAGKTITSLSILTVLRRRGLSLSAFKKGPDYIDAAWLSWAAGNECRNLDTYLVDPEKIAATFARSASGSEIALVEGNRGLLDGHDAEGSHSTANLARLLKAPVVLVVNCTKVTRTVAAMVKGCQVMEPDLILAGVVLNRVAGERHRKTITAAIEQTCGLPVVGAIPKLHSDSTLIPGRHLGLVTPSEFDDSAALETRLASIADQYLDIDRIVEIAWAAEPLDIPLLHETSTLAKRVRIGYFRDSVFTFYYPENLEALESHGAELVPVSSLDHTELPEIDGLYIGGGFPETQAERLTQNQAMMHSVRNGAVSGMPIYAECGGLIYLCEALFRGCIQYDFAGVFEHELELHTSPVGHGYTEIEIDRVNPFFEIGTILRGHEFHYTGPIDIPGRNAGCMKVRTGVGFGNGRDGLTYRNCLACYTHLHADGHPEWASAMIKLAQEYRQHRLTKTKAISCQK